MEDDEPPDSRLEVFVSDNGEQDYVRINGHKLTPFQIKQRLELYEQCPCPPKSFSHFQYFLYHNALENLIRQRFEKGLKIKILPRHHKKR